MYETYYDNLQPNYNQNKPQEQYMVCNSFLLSIGTQNDNIDLKNFEDFFGFSNINEEKELFSDENKKTIGKEKLKLQKTFIWTKLFV